MIQTMKWSQRKQLQRRVKDITISSSNKRKTQVVTTLVLPLKRMEMQPFATRMTLSSCLMADPVGRVSLRLLDQLQGMSIQRQEDPSVDPGKAKHDILALNVGKITQLHQTCLVTNKPIAASTLNWQRNAPLVTKSTSRCLPLQCMS